MILDVLTFPNPRLLQVSKPVEDFSQDTIDLVENMFETMYYANGIGLAAPQVGILQRIIVMDIPLPEDSEEEELIFAFCNPVITHREGQAKIEEGCLSLPEFSLEVDRDEKIVVEAQHPDGTPFTLEAEGLLSICIQHEIDHLDGKLLVNYVSPLKRNQYKKERESKKLDL